MPPNNRTVDKSHVGAGAEAPGNDDSERKARKACINCRRQKMKCRIDNGSSCRRCQRAGQPCIFLPRANAAVVINPNSLPITDPTYIEFNREILRRLQTIEDALGLSEQDNTLGAEDESGVPQPDDAQLGSSLNHLWEALKCLENLVPQSDDTEIWRKNTIEHLWQSFNEDAPGLHFLPAKQSFSIPTPLLLASILYYSSTRGSSEVAQLSPRYFNVLSVAISQLSVPNSEIGSRPSDPAAAEEWAFQAVFAIILTGLITEGSVRETGIWISIAYRLILEHCPHDVEGRTRDWRKLFSGVQIIDLEHASLHLSAPVIPLEPPIQFLKTSPRDQLYRLSRMMNTGLTHFTGRGLPTIWSCFTERPPESTFLTNPFTAVDAAVCRDWARQLDEWLVEFSKVVDSTRQDLTPVFRQYVLHRLVVLSIYHPARGCKLHSNGITPKEQHELLLSARATLKLHQNDKYIWSNWDLVIITWAALIVIQGVECGAGEQDDLGNIRTHLDMLRKTHEPKPSLKETLAVRLEESLSGVHTPDSAALDDSASLSVLSPSLDCSWQIFSQASLEQFSYSTWPDSAGL